MKVILYSTHCPKCIILQKKLDMAKVNYDTVEDVDEIVKTGMLSVPLLKVDDGDIMDFPTAVKWVNDYATGAK